MTALKTMYETYWSRRLTTPAPGRGEILELLDLTLTATDRVLDIGCGGGAAMTVARARSRAVHGCDLAETALHADGAPGAIRVCADVNEGVPYRAAAFDTVTCLDVIEHVVDPARLLREAARVLRPRGAFLLSTPNIRYVRHVARLAVAGEFPHTSTDDLVWGGGHLHYFTPRDISALLSAAGFGAAEFIVNPWQFRRSWKRRWLARLVGRERFGEWLCAGIFVRATKA